MTRFRSGYSVAISSSGSGDAYLSGERCAGVEEDWDAELLAVRVHRPHAAVERVEILVNRREMQSLEGQVLECAIHLVEVVAVVRFDTRKPDELFGKAADMHGDDVVRHHHAKMAALKSEHDCAVYGSDSAPVYCRVDIGWDRAAPDASRLARHFLTPLLRTPDMRVTVDHHDSDARSIVGRNTA
jgi:hypothetical protein